MSLSVILRHWSGVYKAERMYGKPVNALHVECSKV